MKQRQKNKLSY